MPPRHRTRDLSHHPVYTDLQLGDYRRGREYAIHRPGGSRNWLLFVTEAGAGRFTHPDGRVTARPGRLLLVAPDTPHDYGTDPDVGSWTFAWAHCKAPADWAPLLAWPEVLPGLHLLSVQDPQVTTRVLALLRDGAQAQSGPGPFALDLARLRLHEALLVIAQADPRHQATDHDPRIRRVCDHLMRHLGEPHTLTSLARRAGLSPGRFAHLFTATLGQPPMTYVEHQRLLAAARLLQDPEQTVATVAATVGFTNPRHFATRFRRWSGGSPREWRQGAH